MKKIFIFFIILIFNKLYAGMYEVYNYKGYIGNEAIYLTYQIMDDSETKKEIKGLYKYEKDNNPLKISGFINKTKNEILIYKFTDTKKENSIFELHIDNNYLEGIWSDLNEFKKLSVSLELESTLNDVNKNYIFENIEVLQTNSLKDFYFVCSYFNKINISSAQIDTIRIINKKTNKIFQEISLSDYEQSFGNLMTIIYDNIDNVDSINNSFLLWGDIGRMGGYIEIKYNEKLNKFIVDDSIYIDGQ